MPTYVTVDLDGQLSLHCAARGRPLPQIVWHSYAEPLVERPLLRIGDFVSADGAVHSFVNLSRVQPADGGLYTCTARNVIGHVARSAFVRVLGARPVVKRMSNHSALAAGSFTVQCPFAADGPVNVFWFKGELVFNRSLMDFIEFIRSLYIFLELTTKVDWFQSKMMNNGQSVAN